MPVNKLRRNNEDCSIWNSDRSYACRAWTARLSASEIPVSLSLLQGLFVGVVVTLAPISRFTLDAVLCTISWLLLGSIAGSSFCNLQSSLGH